MLKKVSIILIILIGILYFIFNSNIKEVRNDIKFSNQPQQLNKEPENFTITKNKEKIETENNIISIKKELSKEEIEENLKKEKEIINDNLKELEEDLTNIKIVKFEDKKTGKIININYDNKELDNIEPIQNEFDIKENINELEKDIKTK